MKDPKNDSTPVLERFGRDKRKREVIRREGLTLEEYLYYYK